MLDKNNNPSDFEGHSFFSEKTKGQKKSKLDIEASFFQRLLARLVDNVLYLSFFIFVLLLSVFVLGRYFFPNDFNQYLEYSNQFSIYFDSTSQSPEQIISQVQTCSFTSLPGSNINLNQLCQNNKNYQLKIISLSVWVMFFASVLYYISFTTSRFKGTLGKIFMRIKVVTDSGQKITLLQSIAREIFWILYGVAGLVAIYLPTVDTLRTLVLILIIAESSRIIFPYKQKTLHDIIAQTKVIRQ